MTDVAKDGIEITVISLTKALLTESGQPYQREIKADVSLQRHLGIDSLMRAELFQRLEKQFDVRFPDRFIAEAETIGDIVNYLQTAPQTAHLAPSKQQKVVATHGERPHLDPTRAKTLIDIVQLYGQHSPDKAHIYFQTEDGKEEIITYGKLLQSSLQIAQSLKSLGLKEGETVAIMQPTNAGFFYTFFGTLLAGGIPVPIYPPFRMHMLEAYAKTEARILGNAEVRILVTFEQAEKLSNLLKAFVPSLKHVKTVADLMQPHVLRDPFHANAHNFAFIQYTSGSTSDPKGVLLTHANLLANIRAYGKAINASSEDVAVSWLPLYHDMGLIGMWLGSLYFGAPLVLLTPFSFLTHPERWLWAIHYHRGTLSGAPNFAYELCVRKIDESLLEGLDLSSLRMTANGAEKIYPKTLDQFAKKFAPYGLKRTALLPVYGLAESTVGLAIPKLNREYRVDHVDRKAFEEDKRSLPSTESHALAFVSCGEPLEGHEIRIVDEENNVLPERRVGQLQFRGPSSMQGYYNNPAATAAVYHNGWIDSGDLAYLADGEVFITGRRKDLIIKAGRNLYPAEIEELVATVKGVRQGCVAVFGSTDTKRGTEKLIVVAETRESDKVARQKIIEAVQEAISQAVDIVADEIILVTPHTVPKTSSGKLQRSACKKMYEQGRLNKFHRPPWLQILRLGAYGLFRNIMSVFAKVARFIFTVYVALVILITLLPVYLIVVLSSRKFAANTIRAWAKLLCTLAFCPTHVKGWENLKPTPVIYASNHASYIDTIILLSILPLDTRFIGKKELLSAPIIRTFIQKLGHLVVDRMDLSKGLEDTKQIEQVLRDGHSILIFPEGTFSYSSGLRPFRLGAFKIAVETHVPICPIALNGTRTVLRDDEKLLRPGPIHITICEPITPGGTEWQDVTQLRNLVRAEIAAYCGEPTLDFIAAQTVAPSPKKTNQTLE